MHKDVIYIDVEDDITAIIGKIKASKEKIVALVPPKRIGVLQSAVNLRLLARMADNSHKHLVLITNNQALIALSSVAQIPIAKNLQSRPEIAEIAALEVDDDEDVIDGAQLPVGELVKTVDSTQPDDVSEAIETIDVETDAPQVVKPSTTAPLPIVNSNKSKTKVPDFGRFRKRLFITLFLAPFVIGFFVWATSYAPSAKIIITAKTSSVDISKALNLGGTVATDVSKNIIQSITKQTQKDLSVDFTATGSRDDGTKASGVVTLSIKCADAGSDLLVPSGTNIISSSGKVFVSQEDINVNNASGVGGCHLTGSGNVLASVNGEDYNLAVGVAYTVDGYSNYSGVGTAMTGGLAKTTTYVTATDVQKASQALVDLSTDDYKTQLIVEFTNGEKVISDSFDVNRVAAVSVPAIGAEATGGKAKLTSKTTFSITAIAKSELELFLKDSLKVGILNAKTQIIIDDGINSILLKNYQKTDTGSTINIAATGKIGPNIDQTAIKEQVKGLKYGDVQQLIGAIQGVDSVDTKFSYFWVNTVPNDINKIQVEFVLTNA